MISNTDYEKLLIENRKSFREALRRQRKANKLLHAEIERLKAIAGETPIQEEETEEREEMVWYEVIHFYNSGDPLEDTHCSMIRQLMNKYELKRK